jgi:hypothetical protein
MQISMTDAGRPVAPRTAAERATAMRMSSTARPAEAARPLPSQAAVVPVRGGLKSIDPQLNRQVAGAQQALSYLDQLGGQLQDLRAGLSSRLVHRQGDLVSEERDGAALQQQIRRVDELLRARPAATDGTLDTQLGYNEAGQTLQRFAARGLQLESLRSGDAERLSFAVGGRTAKVTSVVVEPGLSEETLVRRFDAALAPSGIRATRNAKGELSFAVAESAWPAVRESFAIKGEGRRFPTGQFSALRLVPEEAPIRPQEWSVKDATATRQTLQHVIDAQASVRQSRQGMSRILAEIGTRLASNTAEEDATAAEWSDEFVRSFEAMAARDDYSVVATTAGAVLGVSRDRVTALLGVAQR